MLFTLYPDMTPHPHSLVVCIGWVGRRADFIHPPWQLPLLPPPPFLSLWSPFHLHAAQPSRLPLQTLHSLHISHACPGSVLHVYALCVHKFTTRTKKKRKRKNISTLIALIYWVLNGLVFRLRSVKMEQRKLNDQANSLVDLAKVS